MKKFYLVITIILFIFLSILALLRVKKLHDYNNTFDKEKEIVKQEQVIQELNKEISKYEELINSNISGEDTNWKQMLEMIEKYL
jgi:cell division protein FtsL